MSSLSVLSAWQCASINVSPLDQRPFKAEGGGRCCYGDCSDVISARRKRSRLWQKMAAAKRSVLSSLAVYAEDSDPESDSETGTAGSDGGTATGEGGEGPGESSGLPWSPPAGFLAERGRPRSFLSLLYHCFLSVFLLFCFRRERRARLRWVWRGWFQPPGWGWGGVWRGRRREQQAVSKYLTVPGACLARSHALQSLLLLGEPLSGTLSWNLAALTPGAGFSTSQVL